MFHLNHPTWYVGKKARDYKTDKVYKAKISDDDKAHTIREIDSEGEYNAYRDDAPTRDDIIKTYTDQSFGKRKRSGGHTTFAVYDNGCVYGTISRGCHAMLSNVAKNCVFYDVRLKELWVSLWAQPGQEEQASVYWYYMLDPKISPWRDALKDCEIIYAEDPYKKIKGKRPVAFVLKDFSCPWQLTAALCITSRMCWQQAGYLTAFTKFLDNGFSTPDAAFLCANIYLSNKGDKFKFPYAGDYAFDTYHFKNMDYDKFVNGKYVIPNPANVHSGQHYNPTNNIFGAWQHDTSKIEDEARYLVNKFTDYDYANRRYIQKDQRYMCTEVQWLVSKKISGKSMFSKKEETVWSWGGLPVADAIQRLKDNEKMWKVSQPK